MIPIVDLGFGEFTVNDMLPTHISLEENLNVTLQLELALMREEVDAEMAMVKAENDALRREVMKLKKTIKSVIWGGFVGLVAMGITYALCKWAYVVHREGEAPYVDIKLLGLSVV